MHAAEVGSAEGLEAVSLQRLATDLGISKSGLFAHFGSKEELQLATVDAAAQIFTDEVIRPALSLRRGVGRVWALSDRWMSYLEQGTFPGGCSLGRRRNTTSRRPDPVRDSVLEKKAYWSSSLERACAKRRTRARSMPGSTRSSWRGSWTASWAAPTAVSSPATGSARSTAGGSHPRAPEARGDRVRRSHRIGLMRSGAHQDHGRGPRNARQAIGEHPHRQRDQGELDERAEDAHRGGAASRKEPGSRSQAEYQGGWTTSPRSKIRPAPNTRPAVRPAARSGSNAQPISTSRRGGDHGLDAGHRKAGRHREPKQAKDRARVGHRSSRTRHLGGLREDRLGVDPSRCTSRYVAAWES